MIRYKGKLLQIYHFLNHSSDSAENGYRIVKDWQFKTLELSALSNSCNQTSLNLFNDLFTFEDLGDIRSIGQKFNPQTQYF